jgi:hypothetical protein
MDYVDQFISNIEKVVEEQHQLFSVSIKEPILIPVKSTSVQSVELRNIQTKMYKRGLQDRMKPGNYGSKEYSTTHNIDVLEDNIFKNNNNENDKEERIDIQALTFDKKMELIDDFLERKNIFLDEENRAKIKKKLEDETFVLKKYIAFSHLYQHITKIDFIKKQEDGTYWIELEQPKAKKTKKNFFKG